MYLIGVLVTYYLFKTVSVIYMFSLKGLLPREASRRRMLFCIIIMIAQTVVFLAFYICMNEMISRSYDFMRIGRLTQLFALYRLIGFLLNATLMICTIYRLKRAKV